MWALGPLRITRGFPGPHGYRSASEGPRTRVLVSQNKKRQHTLCPFLHPLSRGAPRGWLRPPALGRSVFPQSLSHI